MGYTIFYLFAFVVLLICCFSIFTSLFGNVKDELAKKGCFGVIGNIIFFLFLTAFVCWFIWDFFTYQRFDNELRSRFESAQPKDVVSIELDEEYPGSETLNLVNSPLVFTDPQRVRVIFTILKSGKKHSSSDNRKKEWYAIMKVTYRNNSSSEFKIEHLVNGPTYFYLLRNENEFKRTKGVNSVTISEVELNKYIHNDLNLILRNLTHYQGEKSYLDSPSD